ncbi:hypothetical protein [Primorskyibacter sp. 2E233]|uniref:hypothetical protein n=1 Tax=Primorskyibacter sp. 2E233 TaxID=3413431 RepID=UPI003BF14CC9
MGYQFSSIHEDAERLRSDLDAGKTIIALAADEPLDAAGAQLLASAVKTYRASGITLSVEFEPGAANFALWQRLGLDLIIETRHRNID